MLNSFLVLAVFADQLYMQNSVHKWNSGHLGLMKIILSPIRFYVLLCFYTDIGGGRIKVFTVCDGNFLNEIFFLKSVLAFN